MRFSRLTTAALLLATTGCASLLGAARLEREGNATLTGVVVPPAGGEVRKEATSCAGVTARVSHVSEPENALGSLMVKQSRGRCLYVVSNLPSNAELHLEVSPGTTWRCGDGEAPQLTPAPRAVKLRDYETATRDFRAVCD
ncbi:hypothetical protein [Hyalangium rubrum]|uniref:Lipoprotein n=1 Tax=Hyalangium rubrum TaxID=3103134 RepID=A0ABU5HDT3_9BACT|nr:hypothetical protein [Hyalangium sp. s54d21]MDY7230260.1 hypothetical protein [Hyalangium sp. s54d21]